MHVEPITIQLAATDFWQFIQGMSVNTSREMYTCEISAAHVRFLVKKL